jgi:hypothetical protein
VGLQVRPPRDFLGKTAPSHWELDSSSWALDSGSRELAPSSRELDSSSWALDSSSSRRRHVVS